MTVSWITPDERKAREEADRLAAIAIAQAQGKLPNEPTVAASKEVTEPEPRPKPVLLPPAQPKSKMQDEHCHVGTRKRSEEPLS
jgi:hypothetical protein